MDEEKAQFNDVILLKDDNYHQEFQESLVKLVNVLARISFGYPGLVNKDVKNILLTINKEAISGNLIKNGIWISEYFSLMELFQTRISSDILKELIMLNKMIVIASLEFSLNKCAQLSYDKEKCRLIVANIKDIIRKMEEAFLEINEQKDLLI